MISAPQRRQAREQALKCLFGLDFTKYACDDALEAFWDINPAKPGVKRYAEQLVRGVCEHAAEIDALLTEALENWTPDRIGHIERAVLRIAAFEMTHQTDVPSAVAINEAIEIAKLYGADDAPRFVNGVLDRLRRQRHEQR